MRILAFSDLHCDRAAAENILTESANADVIVGAGDFGIRGERSTELFEVLSEVSAPLVLVSGNHDRLTELKSYCGKYQNIFLLDGSSVEVSGIVFFGVGGEIPSRSDSQWNETIEEDIAAQLLMEVRSHHVLVTHTPPYGYCDLQKNGAHEGSRAIASAIKQHAPSLCLCGHIHHSWGSLSRLEETKVHNLGPIPCWHQIADND